MLNYLKFIIFSIIFIFLFGCANRGGHHEEFFTKKIPTKFPPTDNVRVWVYEDTENFDLWDFINKNYGDLLLIGESGFNGPYEDPNNYGMIRFAQSLGTDIVVVYVEYESTKSGTRQTTLTTPSITTSRVSGESGGDQFSGTVTTYGTKDTPVSIPYSFDMFDQAGLFLKNVKNIKKLWDMTSSDFPPSSSDETSKFQGLWKNEYYKINVYISEEEIVGIIKDADESKSEWRPNDLKFKFNKDSNEGIYLMGNKQPFPASFIITEFGYLSIRLYNGTEFALEKAN